MAGTLHILSAGAAKGLIQALQPAFEARHGCRIEGRFGAVGAMQEALLAGEPCDLMVLSDRLVDALVAQGRLQGDARAALGLVRTGVAVPRGSPHPDVSSAEGLRTALLAAEAVYFPDPQRATAGIHFARVMDELGVHHKLQPRLRSFPNGAAAMEALAAAGPARAIGCTQVTEIRYTEGVELVDVLPARFELATLYSAALVSGAPGAALAAELLATLTAPEHRALREAGGFES
jgi:molybdate transport system substrate-binding protein